MKKAYSKPELYVVEYATNTAFCSGCDFNDTDVIYEMLPGVTITDKSFAASEGCTDALPVDLFCKFTSSGGMKIFTS